MLNKVLCYINMVYNSPILYTVLYIPSHVASQYCQLLALQVIWLHLTRPTQKQSYPLEVLALISTVVYVSFVLTWTRKMSRPGRKSLFRYSEFPVTFKLNLAQNECIIYSSL